MSQNEKRFELSSEKVIVAFWLKLLQKNHEKGSKFGNIKINKYNGCIVLYVSYVQTFSSDSI